MSKGQSSKIKRRAWVVLIVIFFSGFGVLLARLFQLQIVDGAEYKTLALQQRTKATTIEPKRGTIYDRNEKVLVQSAPVWNVFISPAEIKAEQLSDISLNLGEILDIPPEDILERTENTESYYERIKMKIDNPLRQEVEDYIEGGYEGEPIRGIYFERDTKRYYIYDNLASTVLGFTNDENMGVYGIEAYYNDILAGTPGIYISAQNPQNLDVPGTAAQTYPAEDGYSVVLTIDETVQGILEKHLEMAVVEHGVKKRAVGIIMNIKTGEILAMSTKPDFDPNQPYEIYDSRGIALLEELTQGTKEYEELQGALRIDQWRNKAISDAYEPGSVYKIVTAAIALEENRSYLDDQFVCNGVIEVADREIKCHLESGHGGQNFFDIMRNSCNPAFVTLGLRNGPEGTYNYMTNFGLGKATGIDLPGEDAGILHTAKSLGSQGQVPLASTSFGQSFTTTPIQLITSVSAAVNGGYLVQPYVVKQVRDSKGNVVETIQPQVKRQVISTETSEEIQALVEMVVSDGSGRHAAIPGYRIGGKTGTSEILTAAEGAPKEYVLSFVGFAPMEDPVYACLVALDEPVVDNPWGSVIAAPVVGAIFQEMLPYLGVEAFFTEEELAQRPVEVPYLIGEKPHDAQSELTSLGLKTKIMGQGSEVLIQVPTSDSTLQKGGTVILFTDEESINTNVVLPDLAGMTEEQAKKELEKLQLNVRIQGVTNPSVPVVVGEQWPVAEATVTTGDVVILTMVEDQSGTPVEIMPEMVPVPEPGAPVTDKYSQVTEGSIDEENEEDYVILDPEPEDPEPIEQLEDPEPEPTPDPPEPVRSPSGERIDGDSVLP